MNRQALTLVLAILPVAFAQNVGTFSGPSILTQGANNIGQRSGQDVNLHVYAGVDGIYDTGLFPYATQNGKFLEPDGLYGIEANVGAYGRHNFRRSVLGLDYNGSFRRYERATGLDGHNQNLRIGYTIQKSRRMLLDFNGTAGTQTFGAVFAGDNSFVNSSSLLFDNRTTFLQGGMNATYLLSNRTSVTVGGVGYTVRRKAQQLVGVNGYNLSGSIRRQVSRNSIIGASYSFIHYDFPRAFGETNLHSYTGLYSWNFGRGWQLNLTGGIFTSEVQGVEVTAVDPVIASLLGVSSVQTIFYRTNMLPTGSFALVKTLRRSSFSLNYERTITPGNGFFLTSRQQNYGAGYSYTGLRRWTFTLTGGSTEFQALGQQLQRFRQLGGSARATYQLGAGFNLTAGYMHRRQDIMATLFQRDASRVTFGIAFQPGDMPISFR